MVEVGDGCQSVGRKDKDMRIRPRERWCRPQSVKHHNIFSSAGMEVGMLLSLVGLMNRRVGFGTFY